MKSIDDLMETFCETFICTANKTGVAMMLLAYNMLLRGEM
jgi:hypothetical protein